MRFVIFCHSLISDWNHGNAHFLRGVVRALTRRGHAVAVYEPRGGWSRDNLRRLHGRSAEQAVALAFPDLRSTEYDLATLDLDRALDGADVVLVHEWNEPGLVARLGRHRVAGGRYLLFFHDTHHRALSAAEAMARYELDGYDGVLAFGAAIRDIYLRRGWARRAWTWHEAADTSLFKPILGRPRRGDLVWIGNWGDEERTTELHEFLIEPVRALGLKADVHGVRYPEAALTTLHAAGIRYGGWMPNHRVPDAFACYGVTVHVPRRFYARTLKGIPTIRPFEAMACGIPLVSAPWEDSEGLFTPGRDFLVARDGAAMTSCLRTVLHDRDAAAELSAHGLATIRRRHTCGHRADELLDICAELGAEPRQPRVANL